MRISIGLTIANPSLKDFHNKGNRFGVQSRSAAGQLIAIVALRPMERC